MSAWVVATGGVILGTLGLVFAGLIALVNRKFRVWEDPRIDAVASMLPNNNCGACGQPGCRAFAEAAVQGAIEPAQCTVMSAADVADVAGYLGVDAGTANKRVARLLCAGGTDVAPSLGDYQGLATCKAAAAVAGGGKACPWACLNLADCERVCDFDAIVMNGVGLPVVIPELCTACGDCVETCPRDLFTLMPVSHKLIVQCKSLLAGESAERLCRVACNACGKCALDAPDVVHMVNNLAVVDYTKHERATPKATERCPTGAIQWVEDRQFSASSAKAMAPSVKDAVA